MKKIVILTTETVHHAFFVRELLNYYTQISVYIESLNNNLFSFQTFHPFEKKRDELELNKWFLGKKISISDLASTKSFESLNSTSAVESLSKESADIVITFGIGRLRKEVIDLFPGRIFNLHGGDTARYRGLDSHLWAIYHQDFTSLITTLHSLDQGLDTGNVALMGDIKIIPGMSIESLRSANTELCVNMAVTLIDCFSRFGDVPSRKLWQLGRYYSAMPSDLKDICVGRFNNFSNKI